MWLGVQQVEPSFCFRSGGKTPIQRPLIDLTRKHFIKQTNEAVGIPGTAPKNRATWVGWLKR